MHLLALMGRLASYIHVVHSVLYAIQSRRQGRSMMGWIPRIRRLVPSSYRRLAIGRDNWGGNRSLIGTVGGLLICGLLWLLTIPSITCAWWSRIALSTLNLSSQSCITAGSEFICLSGILTFPTGSIGRRGTSALDWGCIVAILWYLVRAGLIILLMLAWCMVRITRLRSGHREGISG